MSWLDVLRSKEERLRIQKERVEKENRELQGQIDLRKTEQIRDELRKRLAEMS